MIDSIFSIKDKVFIITGGMGKLGQTYIDEILNRGGKIACFDITGRPQNDDVFKIKTMSQENYISLLVDVTNKTDIKNNSDRVLETWGKIDVLINNAALDSPPDAPAEEVGPLETYPENSFNQVMDVNVKGSFLCCQVIGGIMSGMKNGSIINISSIYGLLSPRQDIYEFRRKNNETYYKPIAYSVSKSAILNMTRYMATYWAKSNVRVNTLTLAGVFNDQPKEFLDQYCKHVPLGRMADAREYIGAIIFLASDASSYTTGSNIVIDGGWTAW